MLYCKVSKYPFINSFPQELWKIWKLFQNLMEAWSIISLLIFQSFMCPLMGVSQDAFMFLSSFSIVLIAVDRFQYICKPHSRQISSTMVSSTKLGYMWVCLIVSLSDLSPFMIFCLTDWKLRRVTDRHNLDWLEVQC